MSKYYKAEDIDNAIREAHAEAESNEIGKAMFHLHCVVSDLPTIEVNEDNQVLYGTDYNCILTMFGECSYNETGCSDCAVAEKIRKALSVEVSEDCISREWVKGICEDMLDEEMLGHMLGLIKDAPSVVPSRAEGEWVLSELQNCWWCGAKMKG